MEKSTEIAELESSNITQTHKSSGCRRLITLSVLIGGVLSCLIIITIGIQLPPLDATIDKGQCASARLIPTSLPVQVGTPLEIQSKLPNQTLQLINTSNAANLRELGQITHLPFPAWELRFNPDNTLSLINNTTRLGNRWSDVRVDPKGNTIVYIESRDSEPSVVRGCDIATIRQIFAFFSDETANQIRFSLDEKLFAVNEGRGTVSLYDAETRAQLTSFIVLNGRQWVKTNQLAFSPDSTLLAFAMDDYQKHDYSIRVWDIKTSKQVATLLGHTDTIYGLTFNDAGNLIASVSGDGSLRLWGVAQQ